MKKALFAFLLILAAALRADAFWGKKSESIPGRRDAVRKALLWVPDTRTLDWEALRSFLERENDASFTLAIVPEEIPNEEAAWLVGLSSSNNIEIALRIPGDPILPLAKKGRPYLAAEKIALSRLRYKKIFGALPVGFVAGGGAILPSDAKRLPRLGIRWTAVGDNEFTNAWYGDEQLVLMPFHSILSTDLGTMPPATDTAALVIDEVAGALPPGSGLAILDHLVSSSGDEAYTTVSRGIAEIHPYVVGPESWPTWRDDLAFWNQSYSQQTAWKLYHRAAKAVTAYQNSGSASIARLNKAEASLTLARSARNFVDENLQDPTIESDFRNALTSAYKAIRKSAPRILRRRIMDPEASGFEEPQLVESTGGDVLIEVKADRLIFTNPKGSTAALPLSLPSLAPDTTAAHLWTPRSLEIGWNETAVDFRIALARLSPSEKTASGFSYLLVDLYIDLNHLSGRGSTSLLSRRKGFVDPTDAWEYVLVVEDSEASLYRSLPGHPPSRIATVAPDIDLENGTITLSIPRRRLRGNPATWGYILTTMMPKTDRRSSYRPPRPVPGETGSPLLGMLGSLDEQRDLTTKRESTYRRFTAQRAGRTNN